MNERGGDSGEPTRPAQSPPALAMGVRFGTSRFLIVLAIAGTVLSSLSLLAFALVVEVKLAWHAFADGDFTVDAAKHLAVELIKMTDLFLLGMVLDVVAIGMYQLFINPSLPVPGWMRVTSLGDLKAQLLNVIVVLLAVTFLAAAVSWVSGRDILFFGAAIGVVIVALAGYNVAQVRNGDGKSGH